MMKKLRLIITAVVLALVCALGLVACNKNPAPEPSEPVTVTLNRTDVQMGIDVDSKIVGASGAFTMQIYHVYSRIAQQVLEALKEGRDVRFTIESRIDDPDAVGGQSEAVVFNNCWINEFPLNNWERDNADSQEYTGGFTPTQAQIAEAVRAA